MDSPVKLQHKDLSCWIDQDVPAILEQLELTTGDPSAFQAGT